MSVFCYLFMTYLKKRKSIREINLAKIKTIKQKNDPNHGGDKREAIKGNQADLNPKLCRV